MLFKDLFKIDKSYWLLVPAILQVTIPWLSFRVRIIYVFALVIVWIFLNISQIYKVLSINQSKIFNITLLWYIVYDFLNNLYAVLGIGDFSNYNELATTINQICFFIIIHYTVMKGKLRELQFLTIFVFSGIIIAALMATQGFKILGTIEGARTLAGTGAREIGYERLEMISTVMNIGLGDYIYVYTCAWIFPLMLIAFSQSRNKILKALLLSVAISCVIVVWTGGLGTPTIVVGMSLVIYLIWRYVPSRKVLKIVGCLLIVVISLYLMVPIVYRPLSDPLRRIAFNMPEGSIKMRLIFLADSFSGDEYNYVRSRAHLQLISWNTFCSYPIFGEGMYRFQFGVIPKNHVGGHSLVLDRLAKSGIIGFLPFVFFLNYLGKYYIVISKDRFDKRWLSIPTLFIILFLFTSIANPTFGVPHMIYIILPGLACFITISNGKDNNLVS